jgi:hypothetical protein
MNGFKLWLLVLESGRFDHDGFNDVFRRQLADRLPRVSDARRRAGLEAIRAFDFVAYILAALRNAGFGDQREREEAAHDVIVQLLVSPGQLFAGYGDTSGPMEARFRISVQNGIRNLLRGQRRRQRSSRAVSIGHGVEELPAHAIPARRHDDDPNDETLTAFRAFLADELGEDAVTLLDRRLDGVSLRQLVGDPAFSRSSAWALRRLMATVRDAALEFARRQGDDEFLAAIERLTVG